MTKLPEIVHKKLISPVYRRQEKTNLAKALIKLDVNASDVFKEFYDTYVGPFCSSKTGLELVDVFDQSPNIISLTKICREEYGFPKKFLVLTDLLGGGALIYDSDTDHVYNIDFEGADQDLIEGTLKPDWESFYDFLNYYFS